MSFTVYRNHDGSPVPLGEGEIAVELGEAVAIETDWHVSDGGVFTETVDGGRVRLTRAEDDAARAENARLLDEGE